MSRRRLGLGRRAHFLALLLLFTGAAGFNLWDNRGTEIPVDVAAAWSSPLTEVVEASGALKARDKVTVRAPRGGLVVDFDLEPGQEVRAGEILALLRPILAVGAGGTLIQGERGLNALVEQAQLSVQRAREAFGAAARDLQRARELFAAGLIPEDQLERADLAFRTAGIDLEDRGAELARVRSITTDDQVTSPLAGTVLEVNVEAGQLVNAGEPLATLADVASLTAVLQVAEADAPRVRIGQEVRLEHTGRPGETVLARVSTLSPRAIHRNTLQGEETVVEVEAELPAPHGLKPGYNVDAEIVIRRLARALFMPSEALVERDERQWALVVRDGRAYLQPLEIGAEQEQALEVRRGLARGDLVVLSPPESLASGALVSPRRKTLDRG